jgi:hypothetical protein
VKYFNKKKSTILIVVFIEFLTVLLPYDELISNIMICFSIDSLNTRKDTVAFVPPSSDSLKEKEIITPSIDTVASSNAAIMNVIKKDKIVKRNGDSIFCKIIGKNLYEVEYQKSGSKTITKLSTASIKELFYSDGRYELIDNNPEKKKKDWTVTAAEKDWNKVLVTSEQADVAGMIEKGNIEAAFEAKKMNTDVDFLEKNAYSILKKKAYSLKAVAVLIVSKTINRTYGELPNIVVKAVAYGKE